MAFSSTVQILKIVNEMRKKRDGTEYPVRQAVVNVLLDNGDVECAGNLRLSEPLLEGLTTGTYRAGFSMAQVTYGDNRGDIVSQLVSLTPVPMMGKPAPAPSAPVAPAAPKV